MEQVKNNIADLNAKISVITLNVHGLNISTKKKASAKIIKY